MITRTCVTLAACAALVLVAGGCGGGSGVLHINPTVVDFDRTVLHADKPVLVDFWKEGCAACGALDPTIAQLADEYRGRVLVTSFIAYHIMLDKACPEIMDRYDIVFVPTVILFDKGQEIHRWSSDYNINNYRKALDEVAPPLEKPKSGKRAGHMVARRLS